MTEALTDREKALVEAIYGFMAMRTEETELALNKALRAYDPPKQKVYTMPSWEEFARGQLKADFSDETTAVGIGPYLATKSTYNAIRELTAKDSE